VNGFKMLHVQAVAGYHMRVAVDRLGFEANGEELIIFPVSKKRNGKQRLRSVEKPYRAIFFLARIRKCSGEQWNRIHRGHLDTLAIAGEGPVMKCTAKMISSHITFAQIRPEVWTAGVQNVNLAIVAAVDGQFTTGQLP